MPKFENAMWKISEGSSLLWKFWDDEYVVFNCGSGDTHLLDRLAGEALKSLEQAPADASGLSLRVAAALKLDADQELLRRVETALTQFQTLGLIEPSQK